MKQFRLIEQHYDMAPNTVVYALEDKPRQSWAESGGEWLTSLTPDGKTLRIIPDSKLEQIV